MVIILLMKITCPYCSKDLSITAIKRHVNIYHKDEKEMKPRIVIVNKSILKQTSDFQIN